MQLFTNTKLFLRKSLNCFTLCIFASFLAGCSTVNNSEIVYKFGVFENSSFSKNLNDDLTISKIRYFVASKINNKKPFDYYSVTVVTETTKHGSHGYKLYMWRSDKDRQFKDKARNMVEGYYGKMGLLIELGTVTVILNPNGETDTFSFPKDSPIGEEIGYDL